MHKHAKWKSFLKGFFDVYGTRIRIIVTGSSRLDVFRRGGDSLTLSIILAEQSSQQLIYSNLVNEINVTIDTVRRWIDVFERLHFGFLVRPWFANVTKALPEGNEGEARIPDRDGSAVCAGRLL